MEILARLWKYVAVIQDDILITGLHDSHHLSNLEKILEHLIVTVYDRNYNATVSYIHECRIVCRRNLAHSR
jgi:hypothetical protein